MSTHAIVVENLSKQYRLGALGHGTLRQDFQSWLAKRRNQTDPNARLDTSSSAGSFFALKDVNFEVKQGEILGVVGRNGAGKSTLLKIISRITTPTHGQIKIRGKVSSLLEVGTGFHPDLTGRENTYLNGAILGMSRAEVRRKFDEIVAFSGIEKFIDTPVKRYSSGMYVRLAFAVAAHLDPEILIVDEVLAVGDYDFQKKCIGRMQDVSQQEGRTVLIVSHSLNIIRRLCDRTLLLSSGQVAKYGPTKEVLDEYMAAPENSSSEFTQPANSEKPIHLLRARILDRKKTASLEFEYSDGFSVEMTYAVNEPVKNCLVWVTVKTMDDVEVFTTCDYDMDAGALEKKKTGVYQTYVQIPEKFLNPGSYYLVLGIMSQSPTAVYDRVELPGLQVIDTKVFHHEESKQRTGLVRPLLNWGIQSVSSLS